MAALKDLMEGDCGGSNALVRLAGQVAQDRSHRQDGIRQSRSLGPQALKAGPTTNQFVNDYLLEQHSQLLAPQTFSMAALLEEMREIDEGATGRRFEAPARAPPVAFLASRVDWASEFMSDMQTPAAPPPRGAVDMSAWSREFQQDAALQLDSPMARQPGSTSSGASLAALQQPWLDSSAYDRSSRYYDVKSESNAWSREFVEDDALERAATEFLEKVEDPELKKSNFMKFVKGISDGDIKIEGNNVTVKNPGDSAEDAETWATEFGKDDATGKSLVDSWADEFTGGSAATQAGAGDFWDVLEKQWNDMSQDNTHPWLAEYEATNPYKSYKFDEDNAFHDHPDPFQAGIQYLVRGDIPNAVLSFEAAVQRNPEHVEAWQYLGTSQAENEQEPAAIAALQRCIDLSPGNLTALMSLAVSYTNETMQSHACCALREWVRQNPKYSHLVGAQPQSAAAAESFSSVLQATSSFMTQEMHEDVKALYLTALKAYPGEIDPDIQCGLGVLFNLSGDYDKAVDCFKTALQIKPKDSLLWNRLGATLANGSRSEEAIDAYRHALGLSPGFIRSRYNLGIACINLGAHREAVEHFVEALWLQKKGTLEQGKRSFVSDNIWSTLRMTLSLMGRQDLHPCCDHRDLEQLARAFTVPLTTEGSSRTT